MLPTVARWSAPEPTGLHGGSPSMGSFGSFLVWSFMGIKGSGVRVEAGIFQPPACHPILWPLLTSRLLSQARPPQGRTQSSPALPPDLPPRLHQWLRWVVPARPIASAFDQVLVHRHAGVASSSFRAPITRTSLTSAGIFVSIFHDFWFSSRGLDPIRTVPMLSTYQALQRTGSGRHVSCSPQTAAQPARRAPQSLSLGSLGDLPRVLR